MGYGRCVRGYGEVLWKNGWMRENTWMRMYGEEAGDVGIKDAWMVVAQCGRFLGCVLRRV